ncbi:MAG TPA: 3-hydroxyacyl-ACP dehydratase FabZ family protein [Chitinophaga sp.]|nr:3-hydroxyacyl-ACP dehydratase FabZ family protein [Chitinophaga sp.]
MTIQEILEKLPYAHPFLFVDGLDHVDGETVKGHFTFREDMDCYKGHFKGHPVTPGVLLTEVMAQIGLVCLGIYLMKDELPEQGMGFGLTETNISFLLPVFPGEKVAVVSQKVYFRFGKLKCNVSLFNEAGKEVCNGTIAGMIIRNNHA